MEIAKDQFDQLPYTVQRGAVHLWARKIGDYVGGSQLFRFNDFFVELNDNGQNNNSGLRTYSSTEIMERILLHRKSWHLHQKPETV